MKRTKLVLFTFLLSINIFASECSVEDTIMYSIAEVEKSKHRAVGYQYLISFNKSDDAEEVEDTFKALMIDKRTMDCNSQELCVEITTYLIDKGIVNLDLGAFQINYRVWKMKHSDYFDLRKSYQKACKIVTGNNKNGWTWKRVANYHSRTPKYNKKYKKRLLAKVEKNLGK